jgi:hypothetical protein
LIAASPAKYGLLRSALASTATIVITINKSAIEYRQWVSAAWRRRQYPVRSTNHRAAHSNAACRP